MKLNGVEVPEKKKKPSRGAQVPKRRKNIFLRIALLAAAVYAIVSVVQLELQLDERRQELNEKIAQTEQAKTENVQLQELLDNSDSYLEEQAREQGMVLPGETVFIEIPKDQ